VEGVFEFGRHLVEWCYRLQRFSKTSTVAPRKHLKTTTVLGYIAWNLYNLEFIEGSYDEFLFLSYKQDLGAYHLRRLKRYIEALPEYFGDFRDLTQAETILRYAKNGKEFICEPEGILSFKRGRHPRVVVCDDILRDPENRLNIQQIRKVTEIFLQQVMSLPKEGGEIHLVGTPQDENDLFKVLEGLGDFNCKRYRAIKNYATREALWPEAFPFERLIQIREKEIGAKVFECEYQCQPVRLEESYFKQEEIDEVICPRLRNYDIGHPPRLNEYCYAGFDIGKKAHPSHLAVFGVDRKGRLVQVHSKWMDGWNYTDQLEYLKMAIEQFRIAKLYYDATRAEFEGFCEAGELPAEMEGLNFTLKLKHKIAAEFEKAVSSGNILLLPDERQKRQVLNVDNELKSMETPEGHGDSFWSICMAIQAFKTGQARLIWEL